MSLTMVCFRCGCEGMYVHVRGRSSLGGDFILLIWMFWFGFTLMFKVNCSFTLWGLTSCARRGDRFGPWNIWSG